MTTHYMTELPLSARAIGRNLSVSSKQCIEICSHIRGRKLETAIAILERVRKKEEAVPFRRFTNGVGHRPGKMAAGRYPMKAAGEFLELLRGVKANASAKGLGGELIIAHLAANRAARPVRNRSKHRGSFKRTHVEVIVTEMPPKGTSAPKKAVKAAAERKERT
jgi:large subunit ribosomal protein L22